jgi:tartrate-resistant acid phosphatase type 5
VSFPPPSDLMLEVRDQEAWLDDELAASDAPWKVTLGHHPYVSNGAHGDAGSYDGQAGVPGLSGDYVKQFYELHACGKADFILAGHDHDLQWLEPMASCGDTDFIVSGAGAKVRDLEAPTDDAFFGQGGTLGFWWIEVTETSWTAIAIGAVGDEGGDLYERTVVRTT